MEGVMPVVPPMGLPAMVERNAARVIGTASPLILKVTHSQEKATSEELYPMGSSNEGDSLAKGPSLHSLRVRRWRTVSSSDEEIIRARRPEVILPTGERPSLQEENGVPAPIHCRQDS